MFVPLASKTRTSHDEIKVLVPKGEISLYLPSVRRLRKTPTGIFLLEKVSSDKKKRKGKILSAMIQSPQSGRIGLTRKIIPPRPHQKKHPLFLLFNQVYLKTARWERLMQAGVHSVRLGLWMLSNAPRGNGWRAPTAPSWTPFKSLAVELGEQSEQEAPWLTGTGERRTIAPRQRREFSFSSSAPSSNNRKKKERNGSSRAALSNSGSE